MYKSRIRKLEDRITVLESVSGVSVPKIVKIEVSGGSVGEKIKAKRIALGMTQESLAAAVGLGRSMIAQIERGSKVPNVVLGRDIARVLQCKLDDLVSDIQ